jgi:hypothetical protein
MVRKRIGVVPDEATAARIAALEASVRALITERSADRERIAELERQREAAPVEYVPLRAAVRDDLEYERARRLAKKGLVPPFKLGGKVMVDPVAMRAALDAKIAI